MHILILAGFMIAMTFGEMPTPGFPAWVILLGVAGYLCMSGLLSCANTSIYLRAIRKRGSSMPADRRRHKRLAMLTKLWLLGGLAGLMFLGYGGWTGRKLGLDSWPLIGKVAMVAPFVLALLLVWATDYPYYRQNWRMHSSRPGWSLRQYLEYNTRHSLLFISVPVALIILLADCLMLYVEPVLPATWPDYLLSIATFVLAATVLCLSPLVIVRIWKTMPMPPGPLKHRLEKTCRDLGLKYRDILIWRSEGVVTNAAVLGVAGPLRYILLSDGLIDQADDRDIEAIFAHEAGHILSHHIFYAVIFTLGLASLSVTAAYGIVSILGWSDWVAEMMAVGALAGVWGGAFGWVSRRFERQSDVIGAWVSGQREADDDPDLITHEGAAIFARALQRIGQLNGIDPRRWNWRHGSIANRIAYILWLGGSGGTRLLADRTVRRIKIISWIMLLVAILTAGVVWG